MESQITKVHERVLFRRVIELGGAKREFLRLVLVGQGAFIKLRATLLEELSLEMLLTTRATLSGELGLGVTPINWHQEHGCICIEVANRTRDEVVTFIVYHNAAKASELERLDLEGNYLGPWERDQLTRDQAEAIRSKREKSERAIARFLQGRSL